MTNSELISAIAAEANITKKDSKEILAATAKVIADALVAGEDVKIQGLGKFEVKPTSARTARNLHTGETIDVPASKKVAFTVNSALKAAVKEA